MARSRLLSTSACAAVFALVSTASAQPPTLTPLEQLGKALFFDEALSNPPGQSCAACHGPAVGFTGPVSWVNDEGAVYAGAIHVRFGNRKPPSAAYAGDSPVLYFDAAAGAWIGGMFWDGRATGAVLGDPLAEQAQGPFLAAVEQNNPRPEHVCRKVAESDYVALFEAVWGPGSLDWRNDVVGTYERIARSIAAYERSVEVNPFSSKFDAVQAGTAAFTADEQAGHDLFMGIANCSACHPPPLFTDFTYDNLGLPANPENPFYTMPPRWNPDGWDWADPGLGGALAAAGYPAVIYEPELGKHKVPTLRNVDLRPDPSFVKAYGHNGVFKSLESIVGFYNTRDAAGAGWPPPEVPLNVNTTELGDLGLSSAEVDKIVAFLKTLSDGWTP